MSVASGGYPLLATSTSLNSCLFSFGVGWKDSGWEGGGGDVLEGCVGRMSL